MKCMKPNALLVIVLFGVACLATNRLSAQSLTEKLTAEDSAKLAAAALEKGDVIRGAILFHQGNINCAKCHRSQSGQDRLGPDLTRSDPLLTDALVVESILQPSKTISKGFETVKVVTVDGQFIDGLVVEEDADKVVLRSNDDPDTLVTILREEIEGIRPGTKSSMPDGLADELKNRQQFLDLVRYVLESRQRGPEVGVAPVKRVAPTELSTEMQGWVLMSERNCSACHQADAKPGNLVGNQAPQLSWSSRWLNPDYLTSFIADPHATKSGTRMPHLLGELPEAMRRKSAEALVQYLVSESKNQYALQVPEADAIARGSELFHSVGCVACHAPRNPSAEELPMDDSTPLGDLSAKYNIDGLVEFLENPLAVRPSGRMPDMQLTHWEATDLASFLLQKAAKTIVPLENNPALVAKGKELFEELKCHACHTDVGQRPLFRADQVSLKLAEMDSGCLSDSAGGWPAFGFDAEQIELIQSALRKPLEAAPQDQKITAALHSFNCLACHERNGMGGVSAERNPYFGTTNMNLGEQGRIPPTLSGVGAKLKAEWMRDVLVNGRAIRPYMKTRMPQFGEQNVGHLVDSFRETDTLSEISFPKFDDQKAMRKMGLELAGNQGLNCVACHTYKYKLSDTMPGVDLTEMAERLEKNWFHQYMMSPQPFSPNTVMPSFWPDGVAIRKDLEGDASTQIEALWQYLIDGRQAGTPRGVVRKPLEIVVGDTPQMLRRSYPGIGKRGIGVGYPGGVNLAFDAEQMRLALIWKGKFVDPAGAWTGQGSGNVRPIGRVIQMAKGPELDDRNQPWVVDDGRPPQHQFQGYFLNAERHPTFQYEFETVEVQDFFFSTGGGVSYGNVLRRELQFFSAEGREEMDFRIIQSKEIKDEGEGVFALGPDFNVKVRIVTPQAPTIVDYSEGQRLQVPLDLPAGETIKLILEYLWE